MVEIIRDLFIDAPREDLCSRVAPLLINIDIDRSDLGEWIMADDLS